MYCLAFHNWWSVTISMCGYSPTSIMTFVREFEVNGNCVKLCVAAIKLRSRLQLILVCINLEMIKLMDFILVQTKTWFLSTLLEKKIWMKKKCGIYRNIKCKQHLFFHYLNLIFLLFFSYYILSIFNTIYICNEQFLICVFVCLLFFCL